MFAKEQGRGNIGLSKELVSVFIYALDQFIKTKKFMQNTFLISVKTQARTFWPVELNSKPQKLQDECSREKNGKKTCLSQSWMTKDPEWFIQFCQNDP